DSELVHSEVKNTSIIQPQEQSGIQYLPSQNGTGSQLPSSSIHEQQEHKPEIPYGGTVDQPTTVPETASRSSTPRHSMSRGPLPQPPNSINNAPLQHPTVPPNFISKQQEAEFYANKSRVPKIHDMLPVYSPQVVEAQWDFNGTDDGDLSFKKGDHIEVTEYVNDDWWRGCVKGKDIIGIFPKVYTKSILQSSQSPRNSDSHQRRTSTNSLTSVSSRLTQQSMNLQQNLQNLQPNLQQNPQQNPLPTNRAQVPIQLQPQQPLNRQVTPQPNLTTPYSYQNHPTPYTSQPNSTYYMQNNQYYNYNQPTFSGGFSGGSKK
ncbi:8543_t:CDS:1, partial [Racocetra persica]